MVKKVLFIISTIALILLSSCENLVFQNSSNNNSYSFTLGENTVNAISRTITTNRSIDNNTLLKVSCSLLRGKDVVQKEETKTVTLKDLYTVSFNLKNIIHGNNYYVGIKIFYNNDILIYEGLSNLIVLNDENNNVNISITLSQHNCTISYDLDGGEFIEGQKGPENYFFNSNITIPSPQKAGFNFNGWYLSKEYKEDQKITTLGQNKFLGDVTLYAKWIEKSLYTVVFNKNNYGVEECPNLTSLEKNQEINLPVLTNGDMTFIGWKIGDKSYKAGKLILDKSITDLAVNNVITFNASWDGIIDPLTFSIPEGEADYNESVTISTTTPGVKIFYSVDGSEPSIEYKNPITLKPASKDIKTITINAKATKLSCPDTSVISKTYTIKTYAVNLDTKGKGTVEPKSFTLWKGETIPKPSDLKVDGYKFEGWYSSQDFALGTEWDFTTPITGAIDLYAKWTPIQYTITYKGAGNGSNPTTYTIETPNITLAVPEKLGYKEGKWLYNNKSTTTISKGTTGDITLTAQLTPITYTVEFVQNGGTGTLPKTISCTYDTNFTLPENNLTKSGFEPNGWSGSDGQAYTSGSMKNITTTDKAVITMTANWTDIAPASVSKATAEKVTAPTPGIKLKWTNPSDADLTKVLITCTEDPTIQKEVKSVTPSGQSETVITTFAANKGTYHFNITAIDGNADTSKNKSTPVDAIITSLPVITQIATISDVQPFSQTVSVNVTGSNFNNLTGSDFKCVSTNGLAKNLTVNVVDDKKLTIQFHTGIKQSTGTASDNVTLTLTSLGASATQNFKIRDYAIGDILYDKGTTEAAIIVMNGNQTSNNKSRLHRVFGIALETYKKDVTGNNIVWAKQKSRAQSMRYENFFRVLNATNGLYDFPELYPQGGNGYKGDENWGNLVTDYKNNGKNEADAENDCPAFATAKTHGNKFTDPDLKAGWYLPSLVECSEICYTIYRSENKTLKELINQKNAATLSENDLYWTSEVPVNEDTLTPKNDHEYAWAVNLWKQYSGKSITKLKTESAFVQPMIAFD